MVSLYRHDYFDVVSVAFEDNHNIIERKKPTNLMHACMHPANFFYVISIFLK